MKLVAVFLVASAVAGASLAAPKLHESAIDDGSKADENRSESASLLDIAPLLVKMNASPRDFDWQSAAKYLADQVRFLVNIVDTLAAENGFSNDWEPVKEKISAILSELENCRNEKCFFEQLIKLAVIISDLARLLISAIPDVHLRLEHNALVANGAFGASLDSSLANVKPDTRDFWDILQTLLEILVIILGGY